MLSEQDYNTLKADWRHLNAEGRAALREYEVANPQRDVKPSGVDAITPPAPEVNVPELPAEAPAAKTLGVANELDTTRDASLPNASKLKTLAAPPEYVPASPLRSIGHIAKAIAGDPLDGPSAGMFFEPSRAQFQADMGEVLKARGIAEGSEAYTQAYDEYRDRKWQQAYDAAKAADAPLTRAAFVHNAGAWDQLAGMLETLPDVASTFTKGYVNGLVPGSRDAADALSDKLTGRNDVGADREQAARNPVAAGVGEFMGAMNPASLASKVAGRVYGGVSRLLPGMVGRGVSAAAAGAAAGDVDLAGRSLGQGLGDVAHGGTTESAQDQFTRRLLPTTLLGAGSGALGEGIAEGAQRFRQGVRSGPLGAELGNLESAGGATDLLRGVKAPAEVDANVEAARAPVPGEPPKPSSGTAIELQAKKLQGPITAENVASQQAARKQIAEEEASMLAADPKLSEPVPVAKTANAAVDLVKARSQPEGESAAFLPSEGQALPARNNNPFRQFATRLWKPRLVQGIDAARAAAASGGKVVTIDEARGLGFNIGDLPDSEGVPLNAPPMEDGAIEPQKILPRYSKDQIAQSAASSGRATPEEAAALSRYTFGKRDPGDDALIRQYLDKAPVSPLPHVYRGMVLDKEAAAELLYGGNFTTPDSPTSVSADPITARSFVARNLDAPDKVGVTLKLEHSSARDISAYSNARTQVEKELLIPPNTTFEVVSKHPDPTNPGNWIVVARETAAPAGKATSIEDVFGRPADKLLPGVPRGLRAPVSRPAPEPGSDWENPLEKETRFEYIYGNSPERRAEPRPDDVTPTRVSNSPPMRLPEPPPSRGAPSGPPSELSPQPPSASIPGPPPGVPDSEYRVVLEPRKYDAKKFEELVGAIDQAAKAGRDGATVDPAWKDFQAAVREDRQQFGPAWSDMKARHHEALTSLEQRAGHANIRGEQPYSEMDANAQKAFNAGLVNYGSKGSPAEMNDALRSLAERAGVLHELETLRAQRAAESLGQKASPDVRESAGIGGTFARVGGLGPAVKLRADAAARALSRGTYGSASLKASDLSPELLDLVRRGAPIAREFTRSRLLPGMGDMGGGALGIKVGSAYNSSSRSSDKTLTPEEVKRLDALLAATQVHQ